MPNAAPATIALFGATGQTGKAVLSAALARGLHVRALVRGAGLPPSSGVCELTGALADAEALHRTLEGVQAVVIVFGQRPPHTDVFCAEATRCILEAMRQQGITRLICQTGAMVGDYPENQSLPMRLVASIYRWRVPAAAADRLQQEEVVRQGGLDWTLLKPPRLTNQPAKGRLRAGSNLRVGLHSSVTRANLAEFILNEIAYPKHVLEAVFLAN